MCVCVCAVRGDVEGVDGAGAMNERNSGVYARVVHSN